MSKKIMSKKIMSSKKSFKIRINIKRENTKRIVK